MAGAGEARGGGGGKGEGRKLNGAALLPGEKRTLVIL